jgi:hypothetical protein
MRVSGGGPRASERGQKLNPSVHCTRRVSHLVSIESLESNRLNYVTDMETQTLCVKADADTDRRLR